MQSRNELLGTIFELLLGANKLFFARFIPLKLFYYFQNIYFEFALVFVLKSTLCYRTIKTRSGGHAVRNVEAIILK